MNNGIKVIIPLLLAVVLALGAAACSSDEPTTTAASTATTSATTTATTTTTTTVSTTTSSPAAELTEEEVRAFADPITQSAMEGLSEGDFDRYTEYANDEFVEAVADIDFEAMSAQLESQVGTFVSAEYKSWEMLEGYIRVHYSAEYTEATIGLLMVFNQDHEMVGQFFE